MKNYAFCNGVILDGNREMKEVRNHVLLTKGNRIEKIIPADEEFSGYHRVDCKGAYLMPGLINMHVHLPASGKPKKKQSDAVKTVKILTATPLRRLLVKNMCAGYAQMELLSGVTTIRTVGGILHMDSDIRNDIAAGKRQGPRILSADMAISVPGGHMAGSLAYVAENAEQAREYVRKIAANKPDLIKLMITGGVLDAKVKGEPGILKMSPELIKAACDEAHRLGFMVAAHVESPEGVRAALENGVDTIEHGATPDEEILQLFHQREASLITTISPALPYALFDRAVSHATEMEQYNGNIVFQGIINCARACLQENIPVGLGTDTGCPYITHYDMWRELWYFQKYCGVSNAFALYTATKRNAEIAGLGDELGTLEAGKLADLIVTVENPLEDLRALRKVSMVMTDGKLILDPVNKKMPQVETELDRFL